MWQQSAAVRVQASISGDSSHVVAPACTATHKARSPEVELLDRHASDLESHLQWLLTVISPSSAERKRRHSRNCLWFRIRVRLNTVSTKSEAMCVRARTCAGSNNRSSSGCQAGAHPTGQEPFLTGNC